MTRSRIARAGVVLGLTAATVLGTATPSFAVTAGAITSSTTRGPNGGGNTIILTNTGGSGVNFVTGSVAAEFSYTTCGTNYTATATPVSASGTTLSDGIIDIPPQNITVNSATELAVTVPATLVLPTANTSAAFYICVYDSTNTSSSVKLGASASAIYTITSTGALLTLSSYKGPTSGGNTITGTVPTSTFVTGNVVAEFQSDGCAVHYVSPTTGVVAVTAVKLISGTKLAVTVPDLTTAGTYYLCIYNSNSTTAATLLGQSSGYSVATGSTITGVTPAAGSAQGGSTITITGTSLSTATAVTVAGEPATITYTSAGTVLATVPAHSAGGPFTVAVTTASGTVMKTGAFTYTNGIAITPNTAPNTSVTGADIDVRGVGFAGLDFSYTNNGLAATTDLPKAHVYLVKGIYNPTAVSNAKTTPQTLECIGVLVVDDSELICTLFLGGVWANGDPTTPVTTSHTASCTITAAAPTTLTSTAAAFAASDIGQMVSGTSVAPGTVITAVSSDLKSATISKAASAAVTTAATYTISSGRSVADITTVNGQKDAVTTSGFFSLSDIGKGIKAANIPVGTVITAVSSDFKTATMSNAATGTNATVNIFPIIPVPIGTYTLTVVNNGAVGAQTTAGYSQSIISSGSTFTVADY